MAGRVVRRSLPVGATVLLVLALAGTCLAGGSPSILTAGRLPVVTTQASPDIHAGGSVFDVATITVLGDPPPAGSVTFGLYGPDDLTCAGAPAFVVTAPVVDGGATSPAVVPTADGTYQWVASYSGDADTSPATGLCGDPGETVHVTAPPAPVDLRLSATAPPATVPVGGTATYTLAVKNKGPGLASGVTLLDLMPASASAVSATASQGSCSDDVTCSLGLLGAGQTATVTIALTATAAGTLTSNAAVLANERDLHPNNNAISVTTEVVAPNLHLTNAVMSTDASPRVGSPLVYTLTVADRGPGAASAVTLTDSLPDGATFVSVMAGAGSCAPGGDGSTVTCDLGVLAAGDQVTVTIDASATSSGKLTNSATVTDAEGDAHPKDDTAAATIKIRPAAGS